MVNIIGNSGADSLITKLASYLTTETLNPTKDKNSPGATSPELQQGNMSNDDVHAQHASVPTTPSCAGAARPALPRTLSSNVFLDRKGTLAVESRGELQRTDDEFLQHHVTSGRLQPSAHQNTSSQTGPWGDLHDCNDTTLADILGQDVGERTINQTPTSHTPSEHAPDLEKHIAADSLSTQDRMEVAHRPNTSDHSLKPCIKTKAKSNPSSPPGGSHDPIIDNGLQPLRRVKTVDFDEDGLGNSELSPISAAMHITGRPRSSPDERSAPLLESPVLKSTSCPISLGTNKSSLANPETTRTDFHIIAVPPSSINAGNVHDKCCRHGKRGLECVNSKLADWSATWNSPSSSFKPTATGFFDKISGIQTPAYNCAIEDDDDGAMLAPPNSQRTSVGQSRHQSRPASAPATRLGSIEGDEEDPTFDAPEKSNTEERDIYPEEALVMLDPDGRRGRASFHYTSQTPARRKFSNIEDSDLHFRDHRDSLGIAHVRMLRAGVDSPHRDSVVLAKKRLQRKKHASSIDRESAHPTIVQTVFAGARSDDASMMSQKTTKEHGSHQSSHL
ncbi:hypothetical protein NX059_006010 [Plenodomus lindquistii]|nr:hypothetical protein NX059_006010 [Plenodomus lindquistii]